MCVFREETQKHKSRAAKYSDRADQLEALKIRIRDLEDSFLNKALKQLSQTQQLQWEKQEAQVDFHHKAAAHALIAYKPW